MRAVGGLTGGQVDHEELPEVCLGVGLREHVLNRVLERKVEGLQHGTQALIRHTAACRARTLANRADLPRMRTHTLMIVIVLNRPACPGQISNFGDTLESRPHSQTGIWQLHAAQLTRTCVGK